MAKLVPLVIEIMMDHLETLWGDACYPVVKWLASLMCGDAVGVSPGAFRRLTGCQSAWMNAGTLTCWLGRERSMTAQRAMRATPSQVIGANHDRIAPKLWG